MKKIFIVGGGFAGITCARELKKSKEDIEVTIFDKRLDSQFLPLLPELISRGVDPRSLSFSLDLLAKEGIKLILKQVDSVDLRHKAVMCSDKTNYNYDYLVLAAGAQVDFHGDELAQQRSRRFYDVSDAMSIMESLHDSRYVNIVVAGGGYTGVELATAIKKYCNEHRLKQKVILLERQGKILPGVPEWMRSYVMANLKAMDIFVRVNGNITLVTDEMVSLYDSTIFDRAMLIWTAGTMGSSIEILPEIKRTPQNRIVVGSHLHINISAFCIGDMAAFWDGKKFIRMGVPFSVEQGRFCAQNIIRSIKGQALLDYVPKDPGFIIPMANGKACGVVGGMKLTGFIPQFLHYFMCMVRSWTKENKDSVWNMIFK